MQKAKEKILHIIKITDTEKLKLQYLANAEVEMQEVLSVYTASVSPRSMLVQLGRHTHSQTRQSCRVCGTLYHTTFNHCKLDRLCHRCLKPGHLK